MKEILKKNKQVEKIIWQVAEVAQYLWQNGWAERNAGNISVNIDELITEKIDNTDEFAHFELEQAYPAIAGRYFFVTATGKRMRDLARHPKKNAVMIKMDTEGKGYYMITRHMAGIDNLRPTSELPTHLGIHQMITRRGSDEKVVIHAHANELVSLTQHPSIKTAGQINKILWGMHPETMIFVPKGLGYIPYEVPGSCKIAAATIEKLSDHDIVLWEKHGVFAVGPSVFDTFDSIDIACKSAKIWFMCKSAGFDPEGLNDKQLEELKELVKKFIHR